MRFEPRGRSVTVTANGIRLHVLVYGEGTPTVLVLPGITSPAITWEFIAEPLSEQHTIAVLDLRGRGLSDQPASGYGLPDYADDAAGVIEAMDLDRPIVLGHSLGARAAIVFGDRHPDLARALVVVDAPLTGPGQRPFTSPVDPYVDALRKAKAGAMADDMREYFPTWPERELAIRADWLGTCREEAIVESYENLAIEDVMDPWAALKLPTLFVYGTDSLMVTADDVRQLAETNPRAELAGVEGAGHMVPWDELDAFLAAVRPFLARHAGHTDPLPDKL